MRFIKKFNENKSYDNVIHSICKKHQIENYSINRNVLIDGIPTIDVDGNVGFSYHEMTRLPINFNKISGSFYVDSCGLTTLEGSPQEIGGWFFCSDNNLTTLEGGPKICLGGMTCDNNYNLISLKGAPEKIEEAGFQVSNSHITSLEYCPKSMWGELNFEGTRVTSLKGCPVLSDDDLYRISNTPIHYLLEAIIESIHPLIGSGNRYIDSRGNAIVGRFVELENLYNYINGNIIYSNRLQDMIEEITNNDFNDIEKIKDHMGTLSKKIPYNGASEFENYIFR